MSLAKIFDHGLHYIHNDTVYELRQLGDSDDTITFILPSVTLNLRNKQKLTTVVGGCFSFEHENPEMLEKLTQILPDYATIEKDRIYPLVSTNPDDANVRISTQGSETHLYGENKPTPITLYDEQIRKMLLGQNTKNVSVNL